MGDEKWPPRSPDPIHFDYYLWGYVKSKVYESPKATDVKGLKGANRSLFEGNTN